MVPANNIVAAPVEVPVAVAVGAAEPAAVVTAPVAPAAPVASSAPVGTFTVTMQTPEGDLVAHVPPDVYLLDHTDELAEENDAFAELPYACRAGSCSACAAKVISGEVDNSDGSFLSDEQKADGFVLTCTSYIKSDAVLKMHAEDDLF